MVTDNQVRRLIKLIKKEKTLATAAAKAEMDEKTARKYERLGACLSILLDTGLSNLYQTA